VYFKGSYFLYHTCINTKNPIDGYTNNRICLAIGDRITGPFYKVSMPVVQDLSCPKNPNAAYCVGQPSAVSHSNKIYLYYTSEYPGDTGANPGHIALSVSDDGVNFVGVTSHAVPSFTQRDVDVKYDVTTNQFLMFQGDVGSAYITWSNSTDGIYFEAYDVTRRIVTNPSLPTGGTNNNVGIAGLPDGTIAGASFVSYGSSYRVGWGDWHLYRTDYMYDPQKNNCSACAGGNGCDYACQKTLNDKTARGICVFPNSTNQGKCCECALWQEPDCWACAPTGCTVACRGAGHATGACGWPGSRNPSQCCVCYD